MKKGAIDLMMQHWARERPDLNVSSLAVLARVSRLARVAEENAQAMLSDFDLTEVEFLLLAAIRTAPDQHPSPRDLLDSLMVTSSGLTNRIDRLEGAGLVQRAANPTDRRGIRIQLTDQGRELVDRVTTAYVEHQNQVLDEALQPDERDTLAHLLRKLLNSLTSDEGIEADQAPLPPRRRTRSAPRLRAKRVPDSGSDQPRWARTPN
ncbi:MAG: MarR family transcriptional regulator [Acidobacteriota bacterium]|nr:MarR family transcriptional regulator [Acidobacteriota bacterium]